MERHTDPRIAWFAVVGEPRPGEWIGWASDVYPGEQRAFNRMVRELHLTVLGERCADNIVAYERIRNFIEQQRREH